MGLFNEYLKQKNNKKVVIISASARNNNCCPNETSKTYKICEKIKEEFSKNVIFETIDLSVKCDGLNVLPCKGCVSTSAFHCHWPCDCYSKKDKDFMHDQDVYKKLEECDGFFVVTPINWSSCSSVLKSFFDRLVCCNLTTTVDEAKSILGEDNLKNNKITRKIEKQGKHFSYLKNHLEGKSAGFFGHGNYGGTDYKNNVKPNSLIMYDENHEEEDTTKLLDPLVRQCVYSGIYVKDDSVKCVVYGKNMNYSQSNDNFEKSDLYKTAKKTFKNFIESIR